MIDHLLLSRLQFALTAMFHILWPVLTIGLSLYLVVLEGAWLKTGRVLYYRQARFWTRLLLLNVAVGVVSGIPLEFQFGTNWAQFARAGGDLFGHLLGFEAAMAFMLEATFLGIMVFGWNRVSPGRHFLATCMVALGASLSAFWIMVANSWMQTPTGGVFVDGIFVLHDQFAAIFNPDAYWAVSHMWFACLEISLFVVGGISAWYLRRGRETDFFLPVFKAMLLAAVVVTPLQVFLGDGSGKSILGSQPEKLAAIEAHWETNPPGTGAAWNVLALPDPGAEANRWQLAIPYALSLITTHSPHGTVRGLREFAPEDRPPVLLPFYAFRVMLAAGFAMLLLALWTLVAWRSGRLAADTIGRQKWLLRGWMAAVPLSYLALEAGWITREVGRQPWIIYGVIRTGEGATPLPTPAVASSLLGFGGFYLALLVLFLLFARHLLRRGPRPEDAPGQAKET